MAGTSPSTLSFVLKKAMYDAAKDTIYDGQESTRVSFGNPGPVNANDNIYFGGYSFTQEPGTLSRELRSREETINVDITFQSFRGGGGDEADIAAGTRANELLTLFEYYARQTNTTFGGLVRQCFLVRGEVDGWAVVNDAGIILGRTAILNATLVADCEVRGTIA